jgi:hypothetical protein
MTLSNSIRVLLPTALPSDQISVHDMCRAQPCLGPVSQTRFELLRGDEGPGYGAYHSEGLARADHYFPKEFSFGVGSAPCRHTRVGCSRIDRES